jgi:hypothetical protein
MIPAPNVFPLGRAPPTLNAIPIRQMLREHRALCSKNSPNSRPVSSFVLRAFDSLLPVPKRNVSGAGLIFVGVTVGAATQPHARFHVAGRVVMALRLRAFLLFSNTRIRQKTKTAIPDIRNKSEEPIVRTSPQRSLGWRPDEQRLEIL